MSNDEKPVRLDISIILAAAEVTKIASTHPALAQSIIQALIRRDRVDISPLVMSILVGENKFDATLDGIRVTHPVAQDNAAAPKRRAKVRHGYVPVFVNGKQHDFSPRMAYVLGLLQKHKSGISAQDLHQLIKINIDEEKDLSKFTKQQVEAGMTALIKRINETIPNVTLISRVHKTRSRPGAFVLRDNNIIVMPDGYDIENPRAYMLERMGITQDKKLAS